MHGSILKTVDCYLMLNIIIGRISKFHKWGRSYRGILYWWFCFDALCLRKYFMREIRKMYSAKIYHLMYLYVYVYLYMYIVAYIDVCVERYRTVEYIGWNIAHDSNKINEHNDKISAHIENNFNVLQNMLCMLIWTILSFHRVKGNAYTRYSKCIATICKEFLLLFNDDDFSDLPSNSNDCI